MAFGFTFSASIDFCGSEIRMPKQITDINKIEESGSLSSGACDICQFRDHCILKKEGRYCGRKRISEE